MSYLPLDLSVLSESNVIVNAYHPFLFIEKGLSAQKVLKTQIKNNSED